MQATAGGAAPADLLDWAEACFAGAQHPIRMLGVVATRRDGAIESNGGGISH